MSNQEYLVVDCEHSGASRRTDGQYWTIRLLGVDDGRYYKTFPDTTMRNFTYWQEIVDSEQYMIIKGVKIKRATMIINADSQPQILHRLTRGQMKELEQDILALARGQSVSTFNSLFE